MNSAEIVSVQLRASRLAGVLLLAIHLLTALILLSLPLPVAVLAGGLLIIAIVLAYQTALLALRRLPHSIVSIVVREDKTLVVGYRAGGVEEGSVSDSTYVGARVICLQWRPGTGYRSRALLLLPDMMTSDESRRLRVLLRLGRTDTATPRVAQHPR